MKKRMDVKFTDYFNRVKYQIGWCSRRLILDKIGSRHMTWNIEDTYMYNCISLLLLLLLLYTTEEINVIICDNL